MRTRGCLPRMNKEGTIIVSFSLKETMAQQTLNLLSDWTTVKEKLKEINTSLTDEDLSYVPGQEDDLLERLSKKLQKRPEEVKALIESVAFNKGIAS
jgi:hypothetical protein